MPQDGSNNYQYPPGTPGIPDTTIESESYNTFLDDLVVNDLNIARPIHRGGTGANNAHDARVALGAEVASQVVTNYDSHIFEAGSFYSDPGATGAPDSTGYYSGTCRRVHADLIVLEAFRYNPSSGGPVVGPTYIRQKWITWGAWMVAGSPDFVNVTGDTMSGSLTVTASPALTTTNANPAIILNKTGTAGQNIIYGELGGIVHWGVFLGAGTSSSATDDFIIGAYNDSGIFDVSAINIDRATKAVTMPGGLATGAISANGNINTNFSFTAPGGVLQVSDMQFGGNANSGVSNTVGNVALRAGTSATVFIQSINGGVTYAQFDNSQTLFFREMTINADITTYRAGAPLSGVVYFQQAKSAYIYFNATNFQMQGGGLTLASATALKPGGGAWGDTSDARIKNILGDYQSGLDAIVQLSPKRFTYKGNDTVEAPSNSDATKAAEDRTPPVVPYKNSPHFTAATDSKEFVGLIAQECEMAFPEMVSQSEAMIDGQPVTDMRTLDTTPLIFALINAVKELKARVEQLESAA